MGNKSSVATIVAVVDQNCITSGSLVTGKVYLQVNQAEGVSCSSICSRLLGQEESEVHYRETTPAGKETTTIKREVKERRVFLDAKFDLTSIPKETLKKGGYEYPFSFTVPKDAPPSMVVQCGFHDRCRIVYSLHVWLQRPGLIRYDIKNTIPLVVVNPAPSNTKTPLYMEPVTKQLRSIWCVNRGDFVLGGLVSSTVLTAGEDTSVTYAALNHSAVKIRYIEIALKEYVTFKSRGHAGKGLTTVLYSQRLNSKEARIDLARIITDNLDHLQDLRVLSGMLDSDLHRLTIPIPKTARSSYNGSMISVLHVLTITAHTAFGSENPSISCSVQIHSANANTGSCKYSDEAKEDEPENIPAGWDPVVATPVVYPTVQLCNPTAPMDIAETEQADAFYDAPPIASVTKSMPLRQRGLGFASLQDALRDTITPCAELEQWVSEGYNPNSLDAEQFFELFRLIKDPFEQMHFAELLASYLSVMTCKILARAAAGSHACCQREVVEKLLTAGPLSDKSENVSLVVAQLTPFQFMTVEKYFK